MLIVRSRLPYSTGDHRKSEDLTQLVITTTTTTYSTSSSPSWWSPACVVYHLWSPNPRHCASARNVYYTVPVDRRATYVIFVKYFRYVAGLRGAHIFLDDLLLCDAVRSVIVMRLLTHTGILTAFITVNNSWPYQQQATNNRTMTIKTVIAL